MIQKYRTDLNNAIREWGNEKTERLIGLPREWNGLGSVLTADVDFRRAGAVAGAVAPYVGAYLMSDYSLREMPESYIKDLEKFVTFVISSAAFTVVALPVFTGILGYEGGKKLDSLVHKASSKLKEVDWNKINFLMGN
ncbi:MAG: hypothetical protein ABIH28_02805 [archaeon]